MGAELLRQVAVIGGVQEDPERAAGRSRPARRADVVEHRALTLVQFGFGNVFQAGSEDFVFLAVCRSDVLLFGHVVKCPLDVARNLRQDTGTSKALDT